VRTDSFAVQFTAAQQRFYQACRSAERWLAFPDLSDEDEPVEDPGLAGLLQRLRQANRGLARTPVLERLRSDAEVQVKAGGLAGAEVAGIGHLFALPHRGVPESWQVESDNLVPQLRLTAVETEQNRRALAATFLLVLALVTIWWLSTLPGAAAWLRLLWPEQLALLAGFGFWQLGPGIGVSFLMLLALGARCFLLGRQAVLDYQRARPVAANGGAGTLPPP
jgi:hypothetical protein